MEEKDFEKLALETAGPVAEEGAEALAADLMEECSAEAVEAAHDEENACGVGDKVRIVETRKLSKDKNWRVAEIVEKAK